MKTGCSHQGKVRALCQMTTPENVLPCPSVSLCLLFQMDLIISCTSGALPAPVSHVPLPGVPLCLCVYQDAAQKSSQMGEWGMTGDASLQRAKYNRVSSQHPPGTPAESRGAHWHRVVSQVKPVQNSIKILEELKHWNLKPTPGQLGSLRGSFHITISDSAMASDKKRNGN